MRQSVQSTTTKYAKATRALANPAATATVIAQLLLLMLINAHKQASR